MGQKQDQHHPVLEFIKVSKKMGKATLIDQLSFEIGRGEIVGLLGPNGAGKTTAIRMKTGLFYPTEGEIRICGHNIRTNFDEAIVHLGAIIENPEFYPYMTARQNLQQYLRMMDPVTAERFQTVVQLVGLEDVLDKKVKAYSLGMRQRLGIAQALLHKPALLILDEPTNGLDPAGMASMRDLIRNLGEAGNTVLLSSHLMQEVEQVCDRVGIINGGKLVAEGRVDELRGTDRLLISASPAHAAYRSLAAMKIPATAQGDALAVTLTPQIDVATINARLVADGIAVRELRRDRASLESVFLKLTGPQGDSFNHHQEVQHVS